MHSNESQMEQEILFHSLVRPCNCFRYAVKEPMKLNVCKKYFITVERNYTFFKQPQIFCLETQVTIF
jgi:hypothetical protein